VLKKIAVHTLLKDAEDSSASGEDGTRKEDDPACQVITSLY
jgi:hypothetical protein